MARMPQVTARELVRFLKSHGFAEQRQSGSQLKLLHAGRGVSVTVAVHTGVGIGRGLAVPILRDAGFSVDDHLALR